MNAYTQAVVPSFVICPIILENGTIINTTYPQPSPDINGIGVCHPHFVPCTISWLIAFLGCLELSV